MGLIPGNPDPSGQCMVSTTDSRLRQLRGLAGGIHTPTSNSSSLLNTESAKVGLAPGNPDPPGKGMVSATDDRLGYNLKIRAGYIITTCVGV